MTTYLPLVPETKRPAVKGWAEPDYQGLPFPEDGTWVGVRADDMVIVDCDSQEAADAWLNTRAAAFTYTVKTPRGYHFYYRHTPGSPTGPAVGVFPGTDIRAGSGSYVVHASAPGYECVKDIRLQEFDPAWLPVREPKQAATGEGWKKVPEGQRNDTLAAFAGTFRSRGMDAEEIGKSLFALNKVYCDPPLPVDEVLAIAKSIGRYEPENTTPIAVVLPQTEMVKRQTGMWGDELAAFQAPAVEWVVEDIIPEGLTILAGKPKVGKSWMSMGLALAVAEGGEYLGRPVPQGKALYLALEDNLGRVKRRVQKVQGIDPIPPGIRVETAWERLPDAAVRIVSFMQENPETKLVIIDTLAKVRHESTDRQKGTYQDDYSALTDLKAVADFYHIAVVVVHHLRKGSADDPLDEVSGTTGLAGAADTILVLKKDVMEGRGRDLEEDIAYDMLFDRETCRWRILGEADFTIVWDLAAWLLERHQPGDMVQAALARDTGLWSQGEFEKQWQALHDDERFVAPRVDGGPLVVAPRALMPPPQSGGPG